MRIGPWEIPDSWAASHRNTRGLAAAFLLLLGIGAMLLLRCDPVRERRSVAGLVLAVEATGLAGPGDGRAMARVRLAVAEPDSGELVILLPPPVPRRGDFVPLRCEIHRRGDTSYELDRERWLIEGPHQARRP